jgi:16S rRNA (cytosine967-C5)-methyltransferase
VTARRAASPRTRAVSVLRDVLERGARAAPSVVAAGSGLSPEDAGLLRELVLGVLRWKSALDGDLAAVCRLPLARLAPNLREILEVALYQIRHLDRVPAYAAVDEAVRDARASGGTGASGLVNAVLRNLLRSAPARGTGMTGADGPSDPAELARFFSHPEFLVRRWIDRLGLTGTRAVLAADNEPSPLDLMANPLRSTREELARALAREGIETQPWPASPLALTVKAGNPLRSPLFAAGHFAVADLGSQTLPLLLPPGQRLIDLAAAPGGKSFAAVLLGRAQSAVALDLSLSRILLLAENRRRLGVAGVTPAAADVAAAPLPDGESERVLFDAPCSGTGTLRKNPEIRYRVTPEAIDRLARAQRAGLLSAARLLAPGGYLLYATCSLEREENEAVVEDVLASESSLESIAIEPAPGLESFVSGARFQMLPGPIQDGFTAHLLRRRVRS